MCGRCDLLTYRRNAWFVAALAAIGMLFVVLICPGALQ